MNNMTIDNYIYKLIGGSKIKLSFSKPRTNYCGNYWYTEIYSYNEKLDFYTNNYNNKPYEIYYEELNYKSYYTEHDIESFIKREIDNDNCIISIIDKDDVIKDSSLTYNEWNGDIHKGTNIDIGNLTLKEIQEAIALKKVLKYRQKR